MSAVKNAEGTQKLSVFKMTWPIFIEILLQMMVGNVDQFMLSHYSQHSVAAVGNANQIINIVILALSVISMAATILIAQHRGAGNREKVAEVCTVALLALPKSAPLPCLPIWFSALSSARRCLFLTVSF